MQRGLSASDDLDVAAFDLYSTRYDYGPTLQSAAYAMVAMGEQTEEFDGDPLLQSEDYDAFVRDCIWSRRVIANWLLQQAHVGDDWHLWWPDYTVDFQLDEARTQAWLGDRLGELRADCIPVEELPNAFRDA